MKHVTGPEMCRALERQGWTLARIRGSNHIYNRLEHGGRFPSQSTAAGLSKRARKEA